MLKKIISVRGILTLLLLLSVAAAAAATYYKIVYWGFSFRPQERIWGPGLADADYGPVGDFIYGVAAGFFPAFEVFAVEQALPLSLRPECEAHGNDYK